MEYKLLLLGLVLLFSIGLVSALSNDLYKNNVKTGNITFTSENKLKSKFLDDSYFDISYKSKNDTKINKIKDDKNKTKQIDFVSDDYDTSFYKIEKNSLNFSLVRYINQSIMNKEDVMAQYAMFEYSESVPTIISYIPEGAYYFYGNANFQRDLINTNNIGRIKTEAETFCPVILTSQNTINIEFHKSGLSSIDEENMILALKKVLQEYNINNIKKSSINFAESMIYYNDGLNIKQLGRIAINGDTLVLFLYIEPLDYSMFNQLTFQAKLKQQYATSPGSLKELNNNIDYSIKEKIVTYFLEEQNLSFYLDSYSSNEINILNLLSEEVVKSDWLLDSQWGSPYIEQEKDAYEYSVTLKKKPKSNVIDFDIETKGLNFYFQGELTQEDKLNGIYKPSNTINSYAVYYNDSKKNNEYKTGKLMHIYRPKIIDSANNWIWANLSMDNNKLYITISQEFLDNAVYPVLVDPTMGYTSIGASSFPIDYNDLRGSVFEGVSGSVNNISIYGGGGKADAKWQMAIYLNGTNGTLITNGESGDAIHNADTLEWATANYSTSPTLSSSNNYILTVVTTHDSTTGPVLYYDTGSLGDGIEVTNTGNYYNSGFPSNLNYTSTSKIESIYLDYTASSSSDTCTCAGLNTNMEIDLEDFCVFNESCNLGTGNITFVNDGSCTFNATLNASKITFKDSVATSENYYLGSNFRGWIG